MAVISNLEGYLMKEKSKTGLFHRLTSDIIKRYFKVQKIEVRTSESKCACLPTNILAPGGWIMIMNP